MPKLIVCQDAQDYRVVEFATSVTIGREAENDITLPSPLVSRWHATIGQWEDDDYVLFDHESTNAVWIENKKVNAIRLVHGMTFRIINYFFTFIDEHHDSNPSEVFDRQSDIPAEEQNPVDSTTLLFSPEQELAEPLLKPIAPSRLEESTEMASLSCFLLELHGVDEESALEERLLARAVELLQAERGFLALLNEKNELIYATTHCFDPPKESREIRQDIIQQVMERRCTVTAGMRSCKVGGRMRSMLCVPLLREDRAIGCLYLDHGEQDFSSHVALSTLEILALHGAALLDNLVGRQWMQLEVLGSAIAKRDSDTNIHNYRVTLYSVRLGERLGISNVAMQGLIKGAFLHDVGKIVITDSILRKPGKLTNEEFEIMKTHVMHGEDFIKSSAWLKDANDVVRCHHEKFDGSGYPSQLQGEDIPFNARIFAVADVFDALTSRRPYKKSFSFEASVKIILESQGSHLDPSVVRQFLEYAEAFYNEICIDDEAILHKKLEDCISRYFVLVQRPFWLFLGSRPLQSPIEAVI